ncbi:MAG: DUF1553 domain-containing protein [Kiritimatiellia bacterium]|jgi:hypothetical protein|nr:DUF1553 domain-containing protein [Kiritimatiellia bacterium]MDP6811206.1 DUF1553 domain-containing protein [Kiritimatiellia bacterium]MDP7024349.1 DUF1553 domain-containing protein [Kiritimatiellia bacterium]
MKLLRVLLVSTCLLVLGWGVSSANEIDRLVLQKLDADGLACAQRCSDAVFVRRVTLDMIGTLPRLGEVRTFLERENPRKRAQLIDKLFARDEFADYWAMKWCDILRVKAEFPSKLWPNAVQAYQRWLTDAIRENMPYDRFAHALLTTSGSNFRDPPVNFYRAVPERKPSAIATTVALTLMGQRADGWPAERLNGMGAFFARVGYKGTAEWKEEVVFFDLPRALKEGAPAGAVFPDGTVAALAADRDPREVFADWLIGPDNPYFARNIVNRIWTWLIGRGLIHEPDDIRPDNPASQPELLAWLEKELVAHNYDLRHIYRLILNSETYQRSCVPAEGAVGDPSGFSHYLVRRLEAEVLIDAINQVTGGTEEYKSEIPEPFTFIPRQHRAITLGDGSITSPFLDMFGRPPRDTGLESERNNEPTDTQRLHLLNSTHIQNKIQRGWALKALVKRAKWKPVPVINQLYLTILSRHPTEAERKAALAYADSGDLKRHEAFHDLAWALINSKEFLYRH